MSEFELGAPVVKRRKPRPAFKPKRVPDYLYDEGIRVRLKPEESLQVQCVNVIREAAPHLRVFHSANQVQVGKVQKIVLKAMGLDKGVVDLCIIGRGRFCAFAECKKPGGYLTAEQEYFIQQAEGWGFPCGVLDIPRDAFDFLLAAEAPGPLRLPARFRQLQLNLVA